MEANMSIDSYETLAQQVDQNAGILTVQMGLLRDVHGAGKLGSIVVNSIHDRLESLGLGHTPAELPTYQEQRAIIYRKGSPVARLIEAVNTISERSDQILRQFASKDNKTNEIVQKIRELVCD
jgi:hypothetical protein